MDHSVRSSVTSSILFTNADDKEAAWDFMKWWTDTETQVSYSREMESLLGTSARYPSANVAAMEQLPWSSRDYRVLAAQAAWAKGVPEVPRKLLYLPPHQQCLPCGVHQRGCR